MMENPPIHDHEAMWLRFLQQEAERERAYLTKSGNLIQSFKDFARSKGVLLDQAAFSYNPRIGLIVAAPGIVKTILGFGPTERDGLYSLEGLSLNHSFESFNAGYITGANYMLMAHPYFRRQMSIQNNFAPRFIEKFWNFNSSEVKQYIAIDEDRLRINVDGSSYVEADTWYGAPFNEDVTKIPNGLVKHRPPADLDESGINNLFSQVYGLDIQWSQADRIKTFQALELKTSQVKLELDGEAFFPGRYLHAEFDCSTGVFRHLDGAVQLFTEAEYLSRRDSDFRINVKNQDHIKPHSKKLFKFNGPLSTEQWVEFCCQFLQGNPLIHEYFTGSVPDYVQERLNRIRRKNP